MSRNVIVVTLTNSMQIGFSLVAIVAGSLFTIDSLTGIKLSSFEQSLVLVLAGLPSFLTLLLIAIRLMMILWTKKYRDRKVADIEVLKRRLSGLGEGVRIRMGAIETVGFAVGLNSAFVYTKKKRKGGRIVVGDQFLRDATDEEVEGILAHELVHIRQKSMRRAMSIIASEIFAVQLVFIFVPQVFILLGALFSLTSLLSFPVSWRLEFDADRRAAERMGVGLVANSLKRLAKTSFVGASLTHPSLSRRMARLQSLDMQAGPK